MTKLDDLKKQLKETTKALERSQEREKRLDDLLGRVFEAHDLIKAESEEIDNILKMVNKGDPIYLATTIAKVSVTDFDKLLDTALYTSDNLLDYFSHRHTPHFPPNTTLH